MEIIRGQVEFIFLGVPFTLTQIMSVCVYILAYIQPLPNPLRGL